MKESDSKHIVGVAESIIRDHQQRNETKPEATLPHNPPDNPNWSDEDKPLAVNEAEKIFAKTDFWKPYIENEGKYGTRRLVKRDQQAAVREVERSLRNEAASPIIDSYHPAYERFAKITAELSRAKLELSRKNADKQAWSEVVREVTKKIRPDLDYYYKYLLIIGKTADGNLYYRTEKRSINDASDELKTAAQITAEVPGFDTGKYIPEFSEEVYDQRGLVLETTYSQPRKTSETFYKIYDTVTPTKMQKVKKWIRNRMHFKNNTSLLKQVIFLRSLSSFLHQLYPETFSSPVQLMPEALQPYLLCTKQPYPDFPQLLLGQISL
jgi:hypothetical protein